MAKLERTGEYKTPRVLFGVCDALAEGRSITWSTRELKGALLKKRTTESREDVKVGRPHTASLPGTVPCRTSWSLEEGAYKARVTAEVGTVCSKKRKYRELRYPLKLSPR